MIKNVWSRTCYKGEKVRCDACPRTHRRKCEDRARNCSVRNTPSRSKQSWKCALETIWGTIIPRHFDVFGNLYFSLISVVKLFLEKIVNWVGKIPGKVGQLWQKSLLDLIHLYFTHIPRQSSKTFNPFLNLEIGQYSFPAMFCHSPSLGKMM